MKRRIVATMLAVMAVSTVLVGCGSNKKQTPTSTVAETTESVTEESTVEETEESVIEEEVVEEPEIATFADDEIVTYEGFDYISSVMVERGYRELTNDPILLEFYGEEQHLYIQIFVDDTFDCGPSFWFEKADEYTTWSDEYAYFDLIDHSDPGETVFDHRVGLVIAPYDVPDFMDGEELTYGNFFKLVDAEADLPYGDYDDYPWYNNNEE